MVDERESMGYARGKGKWVYDMESVTCELAARCHLVADSEGMSAEGRGCLIPCSPLFGSIGDKRLTPKLDLKQRCHNAVSPRGMPPLLVLRLAAASSAATLCLRRVPSVPYGFQQISFQIESLFIHQGRLLK
jgi:hypothetical protein